MAHLSVGSVLAILEDMEKNVSAKQMTSPASKHSALRKLNLYLCVYKFVWPYF